MGAGKSAVGRALADATGSDFVDLDYLICEKTGRSITQIFSSEGETAFRRIESDALSEITGRKNTVIACGGGIVLDHSNVDILKRSAVIVYLSAEPSILLRRVLNSPERRPLLQVVDPASAVDGLLKRRLPLYRAAAELTIDTSQLAIDEVVKKIITELRVNASPDLPQRS